MQVSNRENHHFVGIDPIQHSIRKTVHKAAPDVEPDDRPPFGIFGDVGDCGRDFRKEVLSQPRDLQFVVRGGIEHFLLSRLHHANDLHCRRDCAR